MSDAKFSTGSRHEEVIVLESKSGFFSGWLSSVREIHSARGLLYELTASSIRTRYKNSRLGVLWSFARPLVQLLIYFFAIGQVLGVARAIPDFAIFVFIGLTIWALFTDLVNGMTTSVVSNAGIVKKVYFPREFFPLSSVGTSLFNFGFQFTVLIAAVVAFGSWRWSWDLLFVPLGLLTLVVFSLAIGLFLAALNVQMRDVQHLVEVLLALLFWTSPIVYSFAFVQDALGQGTAMSVYTSNPVTLVVLSIQKALWAAGDDANQTWEGNILLHLSITLLVSLILLIFSHRFFRKRQGSFAQEL